MRKGGEEEIRGREEERRTRRGGENEGRKERKGKVEEGN